MATKQEPKAKVIPAVSAAFLQPDPTMPPQGVAFAFGNGKAAQIKIDDLTPDIAAMALCHGIKQKVVDAAAIARNPETGRSATIADKYEACKAVIDRLLSGEWNAAREGGAGGSFLFRALCVIYDGKKTPEQVATWLEGKSDDEKKALALNPKVAAEIAALRAARLDEEVDTDELLGELDD